MELLIDCEQIFDFDQIIFHVLGYHCFRTLWSGQMQSAASSCPSCSGCESSSNTWCSGTRSWIETGVAGTAGCLWNLISYLTTCCFGCFSEFIARRRCLGSSFTEHWSLRLGSVHSDRRAQLRSCWVYSYSFPAGLVSTVEAWLRILIMFGCIAFWQVLCNILENMKLKFLYIMNWLISPS